MNFIAEMGDMSQFYANILHSEVLLRIDLESITLLLSELYGSEWAFQRSFRTDKCY